VKYIGGCNFIYSSILLAKFSDTGVVQTIGVHRSRDCGHTWTGPFEVQSASNPNGGVVDGQPFDAADKPFIDVDPESHRVLLSWTNFTPFAPGFVGFPQPSPTAKARCRDSPAMDRRTHM
jgi:hypothetical protein